MCSKRKQRPQFGIVVIAAMICLMGLVSCRTPVLPPVRPVANLYPTLHSADVLDQVEPVDISAEGLRKALRQARLLTELEAFGLSEVELSIASRGLRRRGYAELDARRSDCPVRWVVFRPRPDVADAHLLLEAGLWRRPSLVLEAGIDLSVSPEPTSREDLYGRTYRILTWSTQVGRMPVDIRHVFDAAGSPLHWELACELPLADETGVE